MNEATPGSASEIARLVGLVRQFAELLRLDPDVLLAPEHIAFSTGVEADRWLAILAGHPPTPVPEREEERRTFHRNLIVARLNLLLKTRLKEDPERPGEYVEYQKSEIARATKISSQHVSNLLTGARRPSGDHVARMESFFGVPKGFCTRDEEEAVLAHLRQMTDVDLPGLVAVAINRLLAELGTESVALRSLSDGSEPNPLLSLLPALQHLVREQRRQSDADAAADEQQSC